MRLGGVGDMGSFLFPLVNSFTKTEAAIFPQCKQSQVSQMA